ncbi:DUF6629 family protein [Ruegeria conchae]|uniref:DUF6629 family protein n=1 Tax=Ruegeria conchae TaxID=981384 RepID=UPI0029C7CCC4|nr:DUF6629 family protein [Ruegeria conchae]
MCFSANASFAVGGVLIASSAITIPLAWRVGVRFLPLATYPLFFGMQQVAEGFVWLGIEKHQGYESVSAAMVFLFFAYWFWPTWVPFSAAACEPYRFRQRLFIAFTVLGIAGGSLLYLPIMLNPSILQIDLIHNSIRYLNPEMFTNETSKMVARVIYAVIICVPLLLSSHPKIRVFGLLILISVLAGFFFASHAFTSIWCFFAAGLSAYMIVVLRSLEKKTGTAPAL